MKLFSVFFLFLSFACSVSIKEASKIYFKTNKKFNGAEDPIVLLKRLKENREMQNVIYGKNKSSKILSCLFLRNQLYVAHLSNSLDDNLKNTALMLEKAYQDDDDEFIFACDNILSQEVGKIFLRTQEEYLRSTFK